MKRNIKPIRIEKIYSINNFRIECRFSNGQDRFIDFKQLFDDWNITKNDVEYPLLEQENFEKVQLINGTLTWKNIQVVLVDENNKEAFFPYQLDAIVLWENSLEKV